MTNQARPRESAITYTFRGKVTREWERRTARFERSKLPWYGRLLRDVVVAAPIYLGLSLVYDRLFTR